jgi:hypothetical protein
MSTKVTQDQSTAEVWTWDMAVERAFNISAGYPVTEQDVRNILAAHTHTAR